MNSQNLIRRIPITGLLVLFLFIESAIPQFSYYAKSYDYPQQTGRTDISRSIEYDWTIQPEGLTIAGYTNSNMGAGNFDWLFLRLDPMGNPILSTLTGFQNTDSCFSHAMINDNYVLSGFYTNPNNPSYRASFTLLDWNGNHMGSRQVKNLPFWKSQYRQVINNGGKIVVCGFTEESSMPPANQIIVGEYNGVTLAKNWLNAYSPAGPPLNKSYSICAAIDGYCVTGTALDGLSIFAMKINQMGMPLWYKQYRPTNANSNTICEARRIIPSVNGFSIIGWTDINDQNYADVWFLEIDMIGNPVTSYTYGFQSKNEYGFSFFREGQNIYYTGYSDKNGNDDAIAGCFSFVTADSCWMKLYDQMTPNDKGYDIERGISPAGLRVTGQTQPTVTNSLDAFVFKTDFYGRLVNTYNPYCMDSVQAPRTETPVQAIQLPVLQTILQDTIINPVITHPMPNSRLLCVLAGTEEPGKLIKDYMLKQNYPNPFNPTTKIEFSIPKDGNVKLDVYDITGKLVANLINENKKKGSYILSFNASELSAGVYFYKLTSSGFADVKKMILVK